MVSGMRVDEIYTISGYTQFSEPVFPLRLATLCGNGQVVA